MLKLFLILIVILSILAIPIFMLDDTRSQVVETIPTQAEKEGQVISAKSLRSTAEMHLAPVVENVLDNEFCSDLVCGQGDWRQWIILSPGQPWEAEELVVLSDILTTVITSLDDEGLDGRTLLSGYQFRRQLGEYITGHEGRIAVVNHQEKVITLADAAFKRLHGFYIFHELGHIVDVRTDRQLSITFHNLAGTDLESGQTAEGLWLNLHGRDDREEATADAFALWVLKSYDPGYKPVFAYTPPSTKYDQIEALLADSLDLIEERQ